MTEHLFEGAQEEGDVAEPSGVAHQPDAPDLAGERADAATDLDAVALEQQASHAGVVDTVGHTHRRELRKAVALLREQLQPQLLEPFVQRSPALLMAGCFGHKTLCLTLEENDAPAGDARDDLHIRCWAYVFEMGERGLEEK